MCVAKEMADRKDSELNALMSEKIEELHNVKFKHALGQLGETHLVKSLKRDIARLKTVLRQRSIEAARASKDG